MKTKHHLTAITTGTLVLVLVVFSQLSAPHASATSPGLSLTPEWTVDGVRPDTQFAFVAMGDVNGDGYDDLVVGADRYDGGQTNEGAAYLFYGSPTGLSVTPGWMVESNQSDAYMLGSATGDFNGDGYADIVVGAYNYDNGQTDEGRVFVYYGAAAGPNTVADWTAEGNQASARFGYVVDTAGDVNGDGYDDLLVVSPGYDNGQTDEGRAFLYYGSATGLDTTVGWTTESDQGNAGLYRAGTAGDVNGDGYDDVLVGAGGYDDDQTDEGRVWLYYGSATGLSISASWVTDGNQNGALLGSVNTAGDVNNDGYADIIIGAYYYSNGQSGEGRAFVFHGSPTGPSVVADWTAETDQASASVGDVNTIGDVNGDGYADVAMGSPWYDGAKGKAWAFYGSATGLSPTANWTAQSDQSGSHYGWPLKAGDVNGDGVSDLAVGAHAYPGYQRTGRAYVYYGNPIAHVTPGAYDAFDDFSSDSNPTPGGVWSYGYTTSLGGIFNIYTALGHELGLSSWRRFPDISSDASVSKNETGQDIIGVDGQILVPAAEFLHFHPGPNGEYSIVRWTAPVAGEYQVFSSFKSLRFGGPPTTTDVHVLHNSTALFNADINGYIADGTKDFSTTLTLNAGDTVDFAVGRGFNGDYGFDSTGLKATIGLLNSPKPPAIEITTGSSLPSGTIGQAYDFTLEARGGTPPYMWAVTEGTLPFGLDLDRATGAIQGTPTAAASWRFTVLLVDAENRTTTKEFFLTTQSDSPPPSGLTIVTDSALPGGTVDRYYSVTLEATGGVEPYTWSVVGDLPPGLELDAATGEIRGVPITAGTYGFTVQVTDSSGGTASKPFAITPPPPSGSTGSSYSAPIVINPAPDPGSPPGDNSCTNYAVVSGSLPDGLTLDPNTGVISGTPTVPGSYSFVVQCTTGSNQTATKGFTITIGGTNQAPTAAPGGPYSVAEGSSLPLTGSGTDPDGDPLTYVWDLNHDGIFETPGQNPTFSAAGRDGPDNQQVVLRVCDSQDACTTASTTVAIANADPSITAVDNNGPIDEGGSATVTVVASDPAGAHDPLGYVFDCDNDGIYEVGPQSGNTATCAFADDGTFLVNVRVTDDDGGQANGSTTVTVNNVAPTVDAGTDATMDEGSTFAQTGFFSDPGADTWVATVDYNNGSVVQQLPLNPDKTFNLNYTYDDSGIYVVTVIVSDDDSGVGSDTVNVTVNNVAPTATFNVQTPVNEGAQFSLSLTDPSDPSNADTAAGFTYAFDCGDGSGYRPFGSDNSISCSTTDNEIRTVKGTIRDKDGDGTEYTATVTVENEPPTVTASGATINENDTATVSGTISDPGIQDTFTIEVNWGEGTPKTYTFPAGTTSFSVDHQYLDDNPSGTPSDVYTVNVVITDKDGGSGSTNTSVTVNNLGPSIDAITAPVDPVNISAQPVSIHVQFSDPGTVDTHSLTVDWGDGTSVAQSGATSPASASHTYASAGVYKLQVTITDDDTGADTQPYEFLVIYDPNGGFVTGGGWIDSPLGAYIPDPLLAGKANFGFVSKYKKGATVPTGQTEFQFQNGNLNFHSESYQWLVVVGGQAIYGGTGTLNGNGDYSFWVSVLDGKLDDETTHLDKFRIQIRETIVGTLVSPGPIVYDTELGVEDYAAPTTVMSGGQVVIHQPTSNGTVRNRPVTLIGQPPAAVLASLGIQPGDEPTAILFLPLIAR